MRGIAVTLYDKTQSGTDAFGAPIYTETGTTVDNVLVAEPTSDDITSGTDLYGKRADYMLGIPKGDAHVWEDRRVSWTDAAGRTVTVQTFGFAVMGVPQLVPGPWHAKVRCQRIG